MSFLVGFEKAAEETARKEETRFPILKETGKGALSGAAMGTLLGGPLYAGLLYHSTKGRDAHLRNLGRGMLIGARAGALGGAVGGAMIGVRKLNATEKHKA